ncbi:MAG: NUDIX hydrolase [Nocardioides sp.]
MPAPSATDAQSPDVLAAGVVVFRPGRRVLLIHRPKYDDWSFPKGKLDRGEHPTAAAVREVAEETGLQVRLGAPLASQRYALEERGRHKTVHYWVGRPVGDDDVSGYLSNDEIDAVEWVSLDEAADRLTYPHDRDTLAEALGSRKSTRAVILLRHAQACARADWHRDDRERPLLELGREQAARLVPLLTAYGVTRVLSSPSARCRETVEPFARTTDGELQLRPQLSEEVAQADGVHEVMTEALDEGRATVLCTHRPVLPALCEALGVEHLALEPAEMIVVHLRKRRVVGVERHRLV